MRRWFLSLATAVIASLAVAVPITHAQQAWNSVTLSWTTPGDDSLSGTPAQFDIRYSTSPITAANFAAATRWTSGVPAPAVSGTRQSVLVTGLSPSTTYYFAIKTGDEVPNWAGVSNVVSRTTSVAPDLTRPARLALTVTGTTDSTVALQWVATGDDSLTGTASAYDLRYSTSPITEANWASATQVSGEPTPAASGATQAYTVRGLSRQVTYYFAAKVSDEAGNLSALSNVPSATTPDTKAPATIADLTVGWLWGASARSALVPTRRGPTR
jgi:phosphodiesterase/alkaline phosphatase D-like protein